MPKRRKGLYNQIFEGGATAYGVYKDAQGLYNRHMQGRKMPASKAIMALATGRGVTKPFSRFLNKRAPVSEYKSIACGLLPQTKDVTSCLIGCATSADSGLNLHGSVTSLLALDLNPSQLDTPVTNAVGAAVLPTSSSVYPALHIYDKFYRRYVVLAVKYDITVQFLDGASTAPAYIDVWKYIENVNDADYANQPDWTSPDEWEAQARSYDTILPVMRNVSDRFSVHPAFASFQYRLPKNGGVYRTSGIIYPSKHMAKGLKADPATGDLDNTVLEQLSAAVGNSPAFGPRMRIRINTRLGPSVSNGTQGFQWRQAIVCWKLVAKIKFYDPIDISQVNQPA